MNEIKYKISVVMSVYKEPIEWLRQSIDSILQQTFTNFEFIIVCDNPFYDECIDVLKDYSEKDSRIKIIVNEENIGLTKSLNKGLNIARGEYIARMDADDISMPLRFEKQVKFMDEHQDIVASGTASYIMRGESLKIRHATISSKALWSMIAFESPICHPSAIFRRIIDGESVRYDEGFRYSQDYALWLSFIEKHKISNIDEPLIKYRVSEAQISTSSHSAQQTFAIKNQQKAVELMRINMAENEMNALQATTRIPEKKTCLADVESFINSYLTQIRGREDVVYEKVVNHLILIYANYLPKQNNLISALCKLIKISLKVKKIYGYSFLSLINKYVLKYRN